MPKIVTDLLDALAINLPVVGFQILVFVVLFLILRKLLFGRTQEFIRAREAEIEESRRQIEAERNEIDKLMEQYRQQIAKVEKQASEKLQEIVREGIAAKTEILKEAHEKAQAELTEARAKIGEEKRAALAELRAEVSKLTLTTVEKLLQQKVEPSKYEPLIEKAMADFEKKAGHP